MDTEPKQLDHEVPWDADGLEGLPPEAGHERPAWAPKSLSARHLVMCQYHMAGFTNIEIAQHLGMTPVSVGMVLRSQLARDWMTTQVEDMNMEFQSLFVKVVKNMRAALDHDSIDVQMKAMDMWLKANGRYQPKKDATEGLTIEDVIKRLHAGHVQINVDNRQVHTNGDPPASRRDSFDFLGPSE